MNFRTIILAATLVAGFTPGALAAEHDEAPSIVVQGEGRVFAKPTLATVEIGVVSRSSTAAKALSTNSISMNDLIKTLGAQGISESDITTNGFDVSPVYTSADSRAPRISGYSVTNSVHVRIHKIPQVGPVLDAVVASGANQINGISFSVEASSKLLDEARKQALADAKRKATLYAEAGGVTLGKLHNVIEGSGYTPPRPMAMMRASMPGAEIAPPPISAGQQELNVTITAVFSIQ